MAGRHDDLRRRLVEAGCHPAKADRCARLSRQALDECLGLYGGKSKEPTLRGVHQRLKKLRNAYDALRCDRDGEQAFAILQTQPEWTTVSLDARLADIDQAIKSAKRVLQRSGPAKGTRNSDGLDWLLMRLWSLAATGGFKWTAYKNRETYKAVGSFVAFVRWIQRRWPLPKNFVPANDSTLLRSIERAKRALA